MKQPLKQSLHLHLNQRSLSPKQLKKLHSLQKIPKKNKHFFTELFKYSMVATLLVIITSFFILNPTHFSAQSIEQRIAKEVAYNHLKLKPLEISAQTLDEIKVYFKHLNFLPISPSFISSSKQSLIGGRYCSIQGVTALQLRFINNATGQVQSLYETDYDKHTFKDLPAFADTKKPLTIYVKGIKVHIWVEQDILFALTE